MSPSVQDYLKACACPNWIQVFIIIILISRLVTSSWLRHSLWYRYDMVIWLSSLLLDISDGTVHKRFYHFEGICKNLPVSWEQLPMKIINRIIKFCLQIKNKSMNRPKERTARLSWFLQTDNSRDRIPWYMINWTTLDQVSRISVS